MEGRDYIVRKRETDDEESADELVILAIPSDKQMMKKRKYINKKNNHNKKNIKTYFENLQKSTDESIAILTNVFGINDFHIQKGINFYCPFHENKYTSKSPSAKFTIENHTFTCFSTNCPFRKLSTKNCVKMNSINLLNKLTLLEGCAKKKHLFYSSENFI